MRILNMLIVIVFAILYACGPLVAGESPVQAPAPSEADDPFAEVLRDNAMEVVKTGPSCQFIKIQLPPGVSPEDIPGLDGR